MSLLTLILAGILIAVALVCLTILIMPVIPTIVTVLVLLIAGITILPALFIFIILMDVWSWITDAIWWAKFNAKSAWSRASHAFWMWRHR